MTNHLGGHLWKTHVDIGALKFIWSQGSTSLIDVGCGTAGNVIEARNIGFRAIGVDGDPELQSIGGNLIIQHDYTLGNLSVGGEYEVAFSTEFLEHVEEQYLPNIMNTFLKSNIVVCTHALPGSTKGHHHVNLQTEDWWIEKFKEYGFSYSKHDTIMLREHSTMVRDFMRTTGKVFYKNDR